MTVVRRSAGGRERVPARRSADVRVSRAGDVDAETDWSAADAAQLEPVSGVRAQHLSRGGDAHHRARPRSRLDHQRRRPFVSGTPGSPVRYKCGPPPTTLTLKANAHRHSRRDKTVLSASRQLRRCELDFRQLKTVAVRKFEV